MKQTGERLRDVVVLSAALALLAGCGEEPGAGPPDSLRPVALALVDGESCTDSGQCDSGFCVDDVCCENECIGICKRCDVAGALGECSDTPSGQNPDSDCSVGPCKLGYCDGQGACAVEPENADCGTCATCDPFGNCNQYDATQDADCPACQECAGIDSCADVGLGQDPKSDCNDEPCRHGYCNGAGSCAPKPDTTDCGTCARCDGAGACATYDETQDDDCPPCQVCSALDSCAPVPDTTDPKGDCDDAPCHHDYCDGAGSCAPKPDTTDCGTCARCDGAGACAIYDETQDDDCPPCQVCSALDACAPVPVTEDPKDDCEPDACHPGHCDGAGACAREAEQTDCGICAACDAAGACIYDADQNEDCGPCMKCGAVDSCVPQDDGEDLKDECDALPCADAGFYQGWDGDNCHRDGGMYGADCDGTGVCRSAASDCIGAVRGEVALTRTACRTPEGCSGDTPPGLGFSEDGSDPHDDCQAQAESSCGRDGECDGSGDCRLWPAGTVCEAARCEDDIEHAPDLCNGQGACQDGGSSACATRVCVPGSGGASSFVRLGGTCSGGACTDGGIQHCSGYSGCDGDDCPTACAADDDCVQAYHCGAGGQCEPDAALGGSCINAGDCDDGVFCIDGVCCNSVCEELCRRCDVAGSVGICAPVPAGQDPDQECDEDTCRPGTCDGAGACAVQPALTDCGVCASCDSSGNCNQYDESQDLDCPACQQCAGLGSCGPVPEGQDPKWDCAPGPCRTGACDGVGACGLAVAGTDCGVCATCGSLGECDRFAALGTDPDDDCRPCEICAGSSAVCVPVPAGQDPLDDCEARAAASCRENGVCDGAGSCALWPEGTECAAQRCLDGDTLALADTCNGAGVCLDRGTRDCHSSGCADEHCGDQLADGTACTADQECISGHCADQRCCESDCSGPCRSCAIAGWEGQCVLHAADTDPDEECGAISCSSGATRFFHGWDRGACYYHADVSAAEAHCDGSGACKTPAVECGEQIRGESSGLFRSDCTVTAGCTGSTPGALDPVPEGFDPDGDCSAAAPQTCGYEGNCDGRGTCRFWPSDTECDPARCEFGVAYVASLCNGSGDCVPGASQSCFPYGCEDTRCRQTCTAHDHCDQTAHCDQGACVPNECQPGITESCGSDVGACEKGTRTCVDGVWSACTGATGPEIEICDNGLDDDCDGSTDCFDLEDCGAEPQCQVEHGEPDADAGADADEALEVEAEGPICSIDGDEPPIAVIQALIAGESEWHLDSLEGAAPLRVILDGSRSDPGSATLASWRWDAGDGSLLPASPKTEHTYRVPGRYEVRLTVTDCADASSTSAPLVVTITDAEQRHAPTVTIDSLERDAEDPLKVLARMSAVDADGDAVVAQRWNFGEGAQVSGASAEHTYSAAGRYLIEASATDATGLVGRAETAIVVGDVDPEGVPAVHVTADPVAGPAPLVVQFEAFVEGYGQQLSWDFGDGVGAGPKTSLTARHTYDDPGIYRARAHAASEKGVGVGGVTVTVTAPDGGVPPRILSQPSWDGEAGHPYHYDDDDTVDMSGSRLNIEFRLGKQIGSQLLNWPAGMTVDATTGRISWTPSRDQAREPQRVTLVVSNDHGSDFQDWSVTVKGRPPGDDACGCGAGRPGSPAGSALLGLLWLLCVRRRRCR